MRRPGTSKLGVGILTLLCGAGHTFGQAPAGGTITPIKHLVVIFDENMSFDHYFATYPRALNPVGEPAFTAAANTPYSNGLDTGMLQRNPNPAQPFRLDRSQALTCDNDNHYTGC